MTGIAPPDPVLARIKAELVALYGERLEKVVLFGSRARGDAREDSDYDVAVFLHGVEPGRLWPEHDKLADLGFEWLVGDGIHLQAMPFPAGSDAKRTLLMHEIRKDGVLL